MSNDKTLITLWGNDSKRKAFLESYKDWGVWFTTPELELTWYRYQLPDETTIFAMEHKHESYAGYKSGYEIITVVRYYIQKKGKPFTPGSHSSISAVAELLKNAKVSLQNGTAKS